MISYSLVISGSMYEFITVYLEKKAAIFLYQNLPLLIVIM
jgi:hypothetical protein